MQAIITIMRAALARLWRGRPQDQAWERPILLTIMAVNGTLYSWDLGKSGWANYYYSAALQAGTIDAKAFFYGSSDWGNSITVDKPPLSLWVMGLSVRMFGLNPVAMLLPQVIMGMTTTLLIYLVLRRCVSGVAALFGALVFFTTPVVTLMSRYNNPDPLMLLLMVAAVWYTIRNVETGRGGYVILAGALVGLAFMTKQLQGMVGVPALAAAYLAFSPQPWPKRISSSTAGVGALVVTGGAWMTIVDLIPENLRPYVGGSLSNSVLQLTFAYNGVDRLTGADNASSSMQAPSTFRPVESDAGVFRLLNANYNQEASWLLFAAVLAASMMMFSQRMHRTPRVVRALALMSTIWLLTAFFLLSYMGNQIHTYYTATLAPPLALTLGITLDHLIRNRSLLTTRLAGAAIAFTAVLSSWLILTGTTGWPSWLSTSLIVVGIAAIAALVVRPPNGKVEIVAAGVLAVSLLFGPVATSAINVINKFNGSNPVSGNLSKNPAGISHLLDALRNNEINWAHDAAFGRYPETEVVSALAGSKGCKWAAATYASQSAARLQLESGQPVMPVGGFIGSDPSPTLEEFAAKVAAGEICYFIQQEALLAVQAKESTSVAIASWVQDNFHSEKLGNTTVYRLK